MNRATPNVSGYDPRSHSRVSGLSGNEIFCLQKMGLSPGNLCVGNSVYALGIKGSLTAGLNILVGGEIPEVTGLIHDGRVNAISRMLKEAEACGGYGVTGVTTELINHASNIEFLSIGSLIHRSSGESEKVAFSTSADAQELYCQVDAGFRPVHYVLGNVAYSIGVGGNIGGFFRSLARGEVREYSEIFDQTRHLALERITREARQCKANAVVGINTTITPFMGAQEMLLLGTASNHPALAAYAQNPVTSDMTNEEMWNMINIGYLPLRLVMGVSVYSLGIVGGLKSILQSMVRGEVTPLTSLLYEAREKALDRVQRDADRCGADHVVGVKIHVYQLGGGLIEFLAIGTAVKKMEGVTTRSPVLIPQAIIRDRDTFFEGVPQRGRSMDLGESRKASASSTQGGPIAIIVTLAMFVFFLFNFIMPLLRHH
ncbi:heavy metal-binding domain-containing protein [Geomonas sp. RF6]|uniref:heavy metal-binding domain-containing protein n=1 Tax=Geomonas sp. RF6 TaxID=2897342 RepID=UPI001E41B53A|nr:heavy metal-binding domain-containing protein [Geomonas sp. RF6]UFS71462.1 heavy metal-binding domain-containing protein [Geomonas sp. RF6]